MIDTSEKAQNLVLDSQRRVCIVSQTTFNYNKFQDLVETPPKKEDLVKWLNKYQDRGLRYFFNTSGQHYRQQKLKDQIPTMTIDEAAEIMSQDGKLIKRPLVVDDNHLTCGFKEDIFEQTWLA